ncbi:hypothetical protein [Tropheryma whipplei]|uniref:hypothetical protein n=1 Tax=Tropheryma whipplei TaxID=2039 RepID=UPI0012BA8AC5|nr:hypothetical protein [Tropheryma whipplei]
MGRKDINNTRDAMYSNTPMIAIINPAFERLLGRPSFFALTRPIIDSTRPIISKGQRRKPIIDSTNPAVPRGLPPLFSYPDIYTTPIE